MTNRPLNSTLSMSTRSQYIKIARKLTAPLLTCYYDMLTLINGKQGQLATTRDPGCEATVLSHQTRNTLEALFPWDETMDSASFTLSNLDSLTHITPYTICDAASCNNDVANVL